MSWSSPPSRGHVSPEMTPPPVSNRHWRTSAPVSSCSVSRRSVPGTVFRQSVHVPNVRAAASNRSRGSRHRTGPSGRRTAPTGHWTSTSVSRTSDDHEPPSIGRVAAYTSNDGPTLPSASLPGGRTQHRRRVVVDVVPGVPPQRVDDALVDGEVRVELLAVADRRDALGRRMASPPRRRIERSKPPTGRRRPARRPSRRSCRWRPPCPARSPRTAM